MQPIIASKAEQDLRLDLASQSREGATASRAARNAAALGRESHAWTISIVLLLLALSAAPRLWRLGAPSLWYDELRTLHGALTLDVGYSKLLGYLPNALGLAVQGIRDWATLAAHPEQWRAAGIDEIAARLPACILGIVTVPLLFLLGQHVLGRWAALAAALLLATSMWHVYWSQTARFYAIQFLFYNAALLLYLAWWKYKSRAAGAAALLCALLAALSQPTAVVLLGVFAVDVLWRLSAAENRRMGGRILLGLALPVGLFAGAIGYDIWRHPENWSQFFQKPNLPPGRLIFSGGYHIGPAVVPLALVGGWHALRRRDATGRTLLLAAVMPPLLFSLLALRGHVELRYIFPCLFAWLALAVWTAFGMTGAEALGRGSTPASASPGRAFALLVLVLLGAQAVPLYDYYVRNGHRPYTREAAAWMAERRAEGDRVFMDPWEGSYYLGRPVDGDPPALREQGPAGTTPAWVVYRTDERGTKPAAQPWTDDHTQLMAVFGEKGINRMAPVFVRYWSPDTNAGLMRGRAGGGGN